mgnify:CR=1 FL=1
MQAARDGREQAVEVLLAAGADVNAVSEENDTALILAAVKDRRKAVSYTHLTLPTSDLV